MTKDEMTMLLRSVSCNENTVTAMNNAYELGFDQDAGVAEGMKLLVEEAESVCNALDAGEEDPKTDKFWGLFAQLRAMQ
jgi:hypothetical protein